MLVASFVNRCGAIGLSLLPVLLVDRHASTAEASSVMMSVRAVGIVAILTGGVLIDRVGPRAVILVAFLLQAIGLGALPLAPTLALVALSAGVSRVGEALFPAPSRMMITASLPAHAARESIGWMRTANNAGNAACYAIGALFTQTGVLALMWFDSATAALALGLAAATLKAQPTHASAPKADDARRPKTWWPAVWSVLANAAYVGVYELYFTGAAGLYRERFGAQGVSIFSQVMLVNTILCTITAVWAARLVRRVSVALPVGAGLLAVGSVLGVGHSAPLAMLLAGSFVLTLGEILFTSVAGFTLLQSIPAVKRAGTAYSAMLVVQDGGRVLGAALSFPWIVRGAHSMRYTAVAGLVAVALAWKAGREAEKIERATPVSAS